MNTNTNDDDPARITRNLLQPRFDVTPGGTLTDELTAWLAEGGDPATGSAVYLRCLAKEVRAQRAYRAALTHHHVRVTVLSAGHDAIDHGACDGVGSGRVAQPVLLGEMARRVADALCGPARGEASDRVQATTSTTPTTDPGSRVPDCQTCLGKGYVRYLRHDGTRPIDPCPGCAMTGLGDAREVTKMWARLGQEVASSPDWMDRRGYWPPAPNRDCNRVTIPIMIPVRWGVSSDGRRVAVTGSVDPNESVAPTPAPTPSPPVAPASPSSPDFARRTAELIEALDIADAAFCPEHGHNSGIGTLDRIAELRKSALSGMPAATPSRGSTDPGLSSSLEQEMSALGDLDFINLSYVMLSEMSGLDGAAWQAAEDLRQDCYYARMHDHQDARRRVAIALRARAAIKESAVMDAARRWALARRAQEVACQHANRATEDAMAEIERRQSGDYVRRADADDLGRECVRHKNQALEIANQANEEERLAMEKLREVAMALVADEPDRGVNQ